MKGLIIEIRKLLAVKFLDAAYSIMPECKFKIALAMLIHDRIMDDL
jgi:hypothetical protein